MGLSGGARAAGRGRPGAEALLQAVYDVLALNDGVRRAASHLCLSCYLLSSSIRFRRIGVRCPFFCSIILPSVLVSCT
jgi:hypothetical protein